MERQKSDAKLWPCKAKGWQIWGGAMIASLCMVAFFEDDPEPVAELFSRYEARVDESRDLVCLIDGQSIEGKVRETSFEVVTPYGRFVVPTADCAVLSLEQTDENREILLTSNLNRLSGVVSMAAIHFLMVNGGQEFMVEKADIRYILFDKSRRANNETRNVGVSDLLIMANGDIMTGERMKPTLTILCGNQEKEFRVRDLEILRSRRGERLHVQSSTSLDAGVPTPPEWTFRWTVTGEVYRVHFAVLNRIYVSKGSDLGFLTARLSQ